MPARFARMALIVNGAILVAMCCPACKSEFDSYYLRDSEVVLRHLSDRELMHAVDSWPTVSEKPAQAGSGEADLVPVPQKRDVVADYPRFFLYKTPKSDQFWIMKSGGLADGSKWIGPLGMKAGGEIELWRGRGIR